MRRQNLATASLAVWIETNSFKLEQRLYQASKSVRLPIATADTGKLIAAAMAALGITFKPGYQYKKPALRSSIWRHLAASSSAYSISPTTRGVCGGR